jgi:hypothetical protein
MSTASNTPNLPTGQLWVAAKTELSTLEKYLLAFKHHERLLIVLAVLAFGSFGVSRWLNYDSAMKDAKVVALTQVVAQDKQNVSNLALAASTAQAAYQATLDAITKQNVALESSVAQESTILAQRQATDRQLPLPELAQRMEVLVPAAQGGITATTSGVVLSNTAAYGVANTLEQVPVLQSQLASETQVAKNNESLVTKSQAVNADLTNEIDGLNKSVVDITAQGKAEVAAEKVKTKKAFIKGLKYGFGIGFLAGAYIMHAL